MDRTGRILPILEILSTPLPGDRAVRQRDPVIAESGFRFHPSSLVRNERADATSRMAAMPSSTSVSRHR